MFNDAAQNVRIVSSSQDTAFCDNLAQLKTSGLYWCNLSREEAENMLQNKSFGDFLVRDSRMNNCLFTISTKCKTRVLHIRTVYSKGLFSIEGEYYGQEPTFHTILSLLAYYINLSRNGSFLTVFSSKNRKYHVQLLRGVRTTCPTLQHLCRTSINSQIEMGNLPTNIDKLPNDLKTYLQAYPFGI